MNFEVFNTEQELQQRVKELRGIATSVITAFNGSVYTLKWY